MTNISEFIHRYEQRIFVVLHTLFFIGMLYSIFLFGLSYFLIIGIALYLFLKQSPSDRKQKILDFGQDLYNWALVIFFVVYFLSGFVSEDQSYWWSRVRIKMPFLFYPIVLLGWSKPRKNTMKMILLLFFLLMVVSIIPVDLAILRDLPHHYDLLSRGQMSATPTNHIRYSLMIAWATIIGLDLAIGEFQLKKYRTWAVVGSILLFLSLHLLAIRSGLIIVYILLLIYLLSYVTKFSKPMAYASVLILLVSGIFLSQTPSIKEKIGYQIDTMNRYQNDGKWNMSSDGDRIVSIREGLRLASENFWTGVGAGDMKSVMHQQMQEKYRYKRSLLPHNQFVTIFLACGIIAVILCIITLGGILFASAIRKSPIFLLHSTMIVFSCLVENTFETALGVALFVVPFYLGKNYVGNTG